MTPLEYFDRQIRLNSKFKEDSKGHNSFKIGLSKIDELFIQAKEIENKQVDYSEEEVQVKLYECLGHFSNIHNIAINGNEIDSWCLNNLKKKKTIKKETIEQGFDKVFDSMDYTEFDFTSFEQGVKWKEEQDKLLSKKDSNDTFSFSELKERLDNCFDLYTDLFCKKQDVYADGWIGEIKGGINCFADAFLSFDDIRLDLDLEAPKGMIFAWYWDNMENQADAINYHSYIKGLRIKDIKPIEFECDNPHCDNGFIETPYGDVYGKSKCSVCEDKRDS
jgi:hypothetical protein